MIIVMEVAVVVVGGWHVNCGTNMCQGMHLNISHDYSHEFEPCANPGFVFINCPFPLDGL